jgi:hypothetical protein
MCQCHRVFNKLFILLLTLRVFIDESYGGKANDERLKEPFVATRGIDVQVVGFFSHIGCFGEMCRDHHPESW